MPGGFAGLAQGLGMTSDFNAKAYGGLDSGKGFGPGQIAGSGQWGNQSQGALGQSGQYQQGALGQITNNADVGNARGLASQQISAPQYNGGLANLLYQQGVDKSIAAQAAMAHSANPNQAGLAGYNAAQNAAQIQQNAIGQGAIAEQQMRAQYDQMAAQTALQNRQQNLGLLGQEMGYAQGNAGLYAGLAGQQQQLGLGLAGLQLNQAGLNEQGQEGYQQLASQNYNTAQGINAGVAAQNAQAGQAVAGAAFKAGGALLGGLA